MNKAVWLPLQPRYRTIDFSRAAPYFALLFAIALVAFWPTYLSVVPSALSAYTHLHAFTAALWMLMLISQPIAIRSGRRSWHRTIGRMSYVVAPAIVLTVILLAHSRLRGAAGAAYAIQTYVLYLQLSLAALFALCYGAAIAARRRTPLHARLMTGTALTLIDPILIRLMFWAGPEPTWNYQWATFGLTDVVLVALIWHERHRPPGWQVFPLMLVAFVLAQVPALAGWTSSSAWQSFARWFSALPLT